MLYSLREPSSWFLMHSKILITRPWDLQGNSPQKPLHCPKSKSISHHGNFRHAAASKLKMAMLKIKWLYLQKLLLSLNKSGRSGPIGNPHKSQGNNFILKLLQPWKIREKFGGQIFFSENNALPNFANKAKIIKNKK